MSEEKSSSTGFKVSDKRRFDDQGNTRDDASSEAAPSASGESPTAGPTRRQSAQSVEINFSSFVISLATSAMMQLGEMQVPPGMSVPVDPAAARQTIDLLTMLEQKTKGNLDAEEARLLEELLHALRMSYVKHSA